MRLIKRLWNGEESPAKTYWLYCVLVADMFLVSAGLVILAIGRAAIAPLALLNASYWFLMAVAVRNAAN